MPMLEYWKDFHGYSVSNTGRVLTPKGYETRQRVFKKGYHFVTMTVNGKMYSTSVHRLVAELFCDGKSDENNCVNHIDENPHNNRSDNLEWCSIWYNNHYGNGARRRARHIRQEIEMGHRITLSKNGDVRSFLSYGGADRSLELPHHSIHCAVSHHQHTIHGWVIEAVKVL